MSLILDLIREKGMAKNPNKVWYFFKGEIKHSTKFFFFFLTGIKERGGL